MEIPVPDDINDDQNLDDENPDDQDDDRKVTLSRSQIRALEKRPKSEDFNRLQRENTLLRLGIDSDSAAGKMLLGNVDLEWDKPDTIKTIATEAGLLKAPTNEGEHVDVQVESELDQSRERSGLGQGAAADDGQSRVDPRKQAMDEATAAMGRGAREEEAMGHFIHQLAEAAQRGDQRVILR